MNRLAFSTVLLVFLAWAERNLALPPLARQLGLPDELAWPWWDWTANPGLRALWDLGLLATGFLATRRFRTDAARAVTLFLVMALWLSTGWIAWALPLSQTQAQTASFALFWGILSVAYLKKRRLTPGAFALACLASPVLGVDRLILGVAAAFGAWIFRLRAPKKPENLPGHP